MHTPRSLRTQSGNTLIAIVLSLIVPALLLAYLIYLGGTVTQPPANQEETLAKALRLQKVGTVAFQIKEQGERPLFEGEAAYKAQCAACHGTGVSGAPKFANAGEWGPRLGQGFDALVQSALKGKGAMPAQGGGRLRDVEIARAVAFMGNAAGAKFKEPEAPAAQ